MSHSRIPSPARSLGPITPRRYKPRGSRSVGSPARSTASGRLTSVIQFQENNRSSFVLSPAPSRRSVLNDDTYVEEPRRRSWWKKLGENSTEVMEVLHDNKILETNEAVEEYIDIEVLSQEKKNYTIDLPDSSDSESISSIVIPQRKLFTQKDLHVQNKFGKLIGTRKSLAELHKSNVTDKTVHVAPKNLFNQNNRVRVKPVFPAALLNISPNKTANKTKEMVAPEVRGQARNLFGNRGGTKRKNMFADFIVSDSEEEIPDIQPRVFGFPNKVEQRKESSTSRDKREHSPTSSIITDIEMDEWQHIPSSTMVENQIEDMMAASTPVKRARLSNLAEIKESVAGYDAGKEKEPDEDQELKYDDDEAQSEPNSKKKETVIQNNKNSNEHINRETEHNLENVDTGYDQIKSHDKIQNKETDKNMATETEVHHEKKHETSKTKLQNMSKSKNKTLNHSKVQNESLNRRSNRSHNKERSLEVANNKSQSETQNTNKKTVPNISQSEVKNASQNKVTDITQEKHTKTNCDEVDYEKQMEVTIEDVVQEAQISRENGNLSDKPIRDATETGARDNTGKSVDKDAANDPHIELNLPEIVSEGKNNENNKKDENDSAQPHIEEVVQDDDKNEEENLDQSVHQNESNVQSSEDEIEDTEEPPTKSEVEPEESEEELNYEESEEENNVESEEEKNEESEEENNEELEEDNCKEVEIVNNEEEKAINDDNVIDVEDEIEDNLREVGGEGKNDENNEINENDSAQPHIEEAVQDDKNEEENLDQSVHQNESKVQSSEDEVEENEEELPNESDVEPEESEEELNYEESEEENNVESEEENIIESEEENNEESGEGNNVELEDENNVESEKEDNEEVVEDKEENEASQLNVEENSINDDNETDVEDEIEESEQERSNVEAQNESVQEDTNENQVNANKMEVENEIEVSRQEKRFSDGTRNSSAEGSGWDSHRTTRKTLRQTLGRDFTPRKSLRALVMEKSAKRQTAFNDLTSVSSKFPQANSTELPESSMVPEDDGTVAEPNHDVSKRTRQTTLEMYLQKIKKQNFERKLKMEEAVRNSLKAPSRDLDPFKMPTKPMFLLRKASTKQQKTTTKTKSKPKSTFMPLDDLPEEVIEDMKYKPPKRFQPSNAPWITKRLYKFLESKLEKKYDYKARVRSEKLVQSIYQLAKEARRLEAAPAAAVDALKAEMARLDVVRTHFDFYQFFHEYMPREIRVKVVPDVVNKIGMPRHGVFSDILRGNTVQG